MSEREHDWKPTGYHPELDVKQVCCTACSQFALHYFEQGVVKMSDGSEPLPCPGYDGPLADWE